MRARHARTVRSTKRRKHHERGSRSGYQAISTFTVQPGRRDEFVVSSKAWCLNIYRAFAPLAARARPLYTVAAEPDMAIEIADWESADARNAMTQSEAMAAFAPLFELVAAPPSATVVNPH